MSAQPPTPRPLILYVDDEKANRIVFEQSLKEFNVVTVGDGKTAIDLLEVSDVAVLVTDMRMPVMQGDELLRIAKDRFPQVIRMVVTAHQDIDPILRAINEGLVARYIIKPWERSELVQVLQWATEAWSFGRDSAALHRRLMETERLATLGSIAGLLVHDLRQPLMSQIVNIERIGELAEDSATLFALIEQSELPGPVRERLMHLIEDLSPTVADLKASTMHLSDMITGLRDLGRLRTGGDRGQVPAIDPLPIVRHAMTVCQELTMKSRSQLGYDGPKRLPHVRISPTELMQVMINVVSNGAQAVADRGAPNGKVSIAARTDHGMLELQVIDNGVGMAPEVLSRAGTPFFTTREEGTGLGIAQCQRLIGTAGGRFRIESVPGKGTTVTIVLPTAA